MLILYFPTKIKLTIEYLKLQSTFYITARIQCYGVYSWVERREAYGSLEMCEHKSI